MIGKDIHNFASKLWPLNRSLTGEGSRETLNQISKYLPTLNIKSVKSGTKVFYWSIPKEWFVQEAYIITPDGKKICDFNVGKDLLLMIKITFEFILKVLVFVPAQQKG